MKIFVLFFTLLFIINIINTSQILTKRSKHQRKKYRYKVPNQVEGRVFYQNFTNQIIHVYYNGDV